MYSLNKLFVPPPQKQRKAQFDLAEKQSNTQNKYLSSFQCINKAEVDLSHRMYLGY